MEIYNTKKEKAKDLFDPTDSCVRPVKDITKLYAIFFFSISFIPDFSHLLIHLFTLIQFLKKELHQSTTI